MRVSNLVLSLLLIGTAAWGQAPAALLRGAAAYDADDCPTAIPDLEAAKSLARANLLLGRCYFESQQFTKAIEALLKYRAMGVNEASEIPPMVLLAQAYQRDGHGENGVPILEAFLKDHPNETAVQTALGELYAQMGQGAQASAQFQKVVAKWPEDPSAHIGLGRLAVKEEKWQTAIDEFGRAKAVVPNNFDVLSGIGLAYVKLGNCQSAVEPLRQALRQAPTNYPVAKPLAACYEKLQRWSDLMLVALQTGTKEEAVDEDATAMAVHAYQGLADPVSAEKYYKQILTAAPGNVTAHTALGDLYYDAKKTQDARKEYLEVVSLKPSPRIRERLGQIAKDAGQTDEAIQQYKGAAGPGGTDSGRMSLANLCYDKRDFNCARGALDDITDRGMGLTVKSLRARIEFDDYTDSKDVSKLELAGRLANELLDAQPDNPELLRIAGNVAYVQEKWPEAIALLSKRLAVVQIDKDTRYKLVRIYSNNPDLNQLPKAVELLTEYITKFEQDYEAYLLLGNVYLRLDDASNAKENFSKGMARLSNTKLEARLSPFFTSYGILLYNSGDYDNARVQLTTALSLAPGSEVTLYNFALACLQLGRNDDVSGARAKLAAVNSQYLMDLDMAIAAKIASSPLPKTP